MRSKKADLFVSDPIAIVLIIFALLVFSYLFFVLNFAYSKNIVLAPEQEYTSSARLVSLLKTPVQFDIDKDGKPDSVSIGNLLVLKYNEDPSLFDASARNELGSLLAKIPKPESTQAGWNLKVNFLNSEEKDYIVSGPVEAREFLKQSVILPTSEKGKILKVTLYFSCVSCEQKDLEGFA